MTRSNTTGNKKRSKGLFFIAAGAAAAALLGGGSFAVWTATSFGDVAEVEAGSLTIDDTVVTAWTHDTVTGASVVKVVPEDVIVAKASTTVRGAGDTLQGVLTVDLPAIDEDGFSVEFLTTVDNVEYVPGSPIDLSDETADIATVVTVTFDDTAVADSEVAGLMETIQAATGIQYTVTQVTQ